MSITEIVTYINNKSLEKILPDHNLETEMLMKRLLVNHIKKNDLLSKCTPDSIMDAAKEGLAFGLIPGRHFYLIPYGKEATIRYDWKGKLELCYRSPKVKLVQVATVDKSDDFSIDLGELKVHHIITSNPSGEIVGAYARAWLEGSPVPQIEYMPKADIDKCRSCAQTPKIWAKWEGQMAKKSVLHRLMNYLPQLPPQVVQFIKEEQERDVTPTTPELPPKDEPQSPDVPKDEKTLEGALDEVKTDEVPQE